MIIIIKFTENTLSLDKLMDLLSNRLKPTYRVPSGLLFN